MKIINNNKCKECCYCMDDYDGFGICCKDNIYKNINPNQQACKYFCNDDEEQYYNNYNNNFNLNEDDYYDIYD